MLIAIIDKNGKVGHPTTKVRYVRQKLKDDQAKIIKGSLINNDFEVVQILDLEIDDNDTVDAKFRLGIDPGYLNIGFCLIKETTISKLNNEYTAYANGVLRDMDTVTSDMATVTSTNPTVKLGFNHFFGHIRNFRIYDRALTTAEIAAA